MDTRKTIMRTTTKKDGKTMGKNTTIMKTSLMRKDNTRKSSTRTDQKGKINGSSIKRERTVILLWSQRPKRLNPKNRSTSKRNDWNKMNLYLNMEKWYEKVRLGIKQTI